MCTKTKSYCQIRRRGSLDAGWRRGVAVRSQSLSPSGELNKRRALVFGSKKLEARVGIEPTHKGFADPFSSQLSLSTPTLDFDLKPFCPLSVRFSELPMRDAPWEAAQMEVQ
jgi:hypothetical protein